MRKILPVIVCLLGLGLPAAAGEEPLARRVDKLFAEFDRADSPGCALGVIKDGDFLYERGFGMASLEYGIPITPSSVFRTGSVGKQFTAMAVALASEQGKLALDDDIRKYLPEIPDYGSAVTIRHLIHHTSGLRDYLELMEMAGKSDADYYSDDDVVEMLARQRALNFEPGAEYLYSNSGYFLLSQIILRATGKSLRAFAAQYVFEPLGMKSTHFHDEPSEIVPRRASGYAPRAGGGYRISMTSLPMVGDGGVFTSVRDLLLWDRNFYDNKLGETGKELIEMLETPGWLADGSPLSYGFGLRVSDYRGLRAVGHTGEFVGFRAAVLRFPGQHFSVICLCNVNSANPGGLARQVADIHLAGELGPPQGTAAPASGSEASSSETATTLLVPAERLANFAGEYTSEELGISYRLEVKDGGLFFTHRNAPEGSLQATGENSFRLGSLRLEFQRKGDSRATSFSLHSGRVRDIRFTRK